MNPGDTITTTFGTVTHRVERDTPDALYTTCGRRVDKMTLKPRTKRPPCPRCAAVCEERGEA